MRLRLGVLLVDAAGGVGDRNRLPLRSVGAIALG